MRQNEYLTSNTHVAFPFRDGQPVPDEVRRLFVDASILSEAWDVELTGIEYSASGQTLSFTVGGKAYDARTDGVQDRTTAYRRLEYAESGASFVIDAWYLQGVASFSYGGLHVLFERSCVFVEPAGVDSITIYERTGDGFVESTVSGDVVLAPGYNIGMSCSDAGITIDAGRGLGLGTVPCDGECGDDVDTDGHPLPTDDGHAVITGDECYEVVVRSSDDSPQEGRPVLDTIQIVGKCVACCQCQQFVDVVGVLKEIAQRVADVKGAIAGRQTDSYNGLVDDLTSSSRPDVDIQLDISPDSGVLQYATERQAGNADASLNVATRNAMYFRVTCVVTNLSGVPCAIGVPSGGKGNGLSVSAGYGTISNESSAKGDPGGWLVYSKVRGAQYRNGGQRSGTSDEGYTDIGNLKSASWGDGDAARAWEALSEKALMDLSAGLNKSSSTGQTKDIDLTGQYAGGKGFVMAPGYSFTITNLYAVLSSDVAGGSNVRASFACNLFAPLLLYAKAYNMATPTTRIRDSSEGGHYTETTWSLPDGTPDVMAASVREVTATIGYNYRTNEYTGA